MQEFRKGGGGGETTPPKSLRSSAEMSPVLGFDLSLAVCVPHVQSCTVLQHPVPWDYRQRNPIGSSVAWDYRHRTPIGSWVVSGLSGGCSRVARCNHHAALNTKSSYRVKLYQQ